ncbi:phosphatase PAP2 family protein [Mucilaginibacter sp.]|jgi:undecaprenyl-diphosphatase|uniref:phosphatase PAP2 family protein n=1 Tax=Mucilaginibacter sp. TaxID=1882438 RepID=UPI0035616F20
MMTNKSFSYPKIGLLLLCFLSFSVILATIFYNYDKSLVIHFNQLRNPFWDLFFLNITNSAGFIAYGTSIILLLLSFLIKERAVKYKFYKIALAGVFSGLAVTLLKNGIQRVRPFQLYPAIHSLGPGGGWSYPSGHTSDAFFLAAIIWLVYPNRRLLIVAVYLWATLVGISRVYLGVHYPSDVLAAVAVGSVSSLAAFVVLDWFIKRSSTGQFG